MQRDKHTDRHNERERERERGGGGGTGGCRETSIQTDTRDGQRRKHKGRQRNGDDGTETE